MNTVQRNPKSYPSDPHEDRWNNLTITPNIVVPSYSYIQGDDEDMIDEYQGEGARKNTISTKGSVQIESLKSIQKQDDEYKAYNTKVSKQLDDIRNMTLFPNKYYRFPISNHPFAHLGLSNNNELEKALHTYEDRVKDLEKEIDVRERDTLKLSDIIKILMEENNYLKDHIHHKNREIQKTLQTIGLNDAEAIKELRHKLGILEEEGSVILSKLEESEGSRRNIEKKYDDKEHEYDKLSREYKTCKGNLSEALARESFLTTQNHSLNVKFQKSQEKAQSLETALEEASNKLEKLQHKHELTSNQLENTKKHLDEVYNSQSLEMNDIVQNNVKLLNENEELQKLVQSQKKALEDREKQTKKMTRDLNDLRLEDEEYLQRLQSMKNDLTHETRAREMAQKNEKILEERNKKFELEIKELEDALRTNERDHKSTIEVLTNDLERQAKEYDSKIEKLKNKIKEITNEKDDIISSLRDRIRNLEGAIIKNHNKPKLATIDIQDNNEYASGSSKDIKDGPNSAISELAKQILQEQKSSVILTPRGDIYVNPQLESYSYTSPNYRAYKGYEEKNTWNDSTAEKSFNNNDRYVKTEYYQSNTSEPAYRNLREVKSVNEFEPYLPREEYSPSKETPKKKALSHKQVKNLVSDILNKNDSAADIDKYRLGASINSASSRASINQRATEKPARSFKPYSPTYSTGKTLKSPYQNYKPLYLMSFKD